METVNMDKSIEINGIFSNFLYFRAGKFVNIKNIRNNRGMINQIKF